MKDKVLNLLIPLSVVGLAIFVLLVSRPTKNESSVEYLKFKEYADSIKKENEVMERRIDSLSRILEFKSDSLDKKLDTLKTEKNEKINVIVNLPIDSAILFLTDKLLSEEDYIE